MSGQTNSEAPHVLNTLPDRDHEWLNTLKDKAIHCHHRRRPRHWSGRITEACLANKAFFKLGCKGVASAPYDATKGDVRNMAHIIAMERAKHGIRVNSVSTGFVKSALTYYVEVSHDRDLKMQYYGCMSRLALPQDLRGAYPL
ncbi:unnamed protein product [Clonostachys rosea]|uniref:Uncharacterized protein n=1 Tax=Bionectria ochroleuca TaxID=29856 RepID=A0ABY6U168_BIOOC|nr:unnamed protein product [Clonostachys rosea]